MQVVWSVRISEKMEMMVVVVVVVGLDSACTVKGNAWQCIGPRGPTATHKHKHKQKSRVYGS